LLIDSALNLFKFSLMQYPSIVQASAAAISFHRHPEQKGPHEKISVNPGKVVHGGFAAGTCKSVVV